MINTEWIKCEEQKYFKMGYDAGVLETQLDNARKAPAQTEQVPAVFYRCMNCKHAYEDKPVTSCDCMAISYFERIEYYTSPPEHEWVGLTDMERLACQSFSHAQTVINTEAKLKELNHDNKTEALKLALEALEELNDTEQTYAAIDRGYAAISAIKEALAQPEQEPNQETITIQEAWEACGGNPGIQATKSELVTTLKMLDEVCNEAQPKREWVGLTDEQVAEIERMSTTRSQAIRAIDAKLKELNHEV